MHSVFRHDGSGRLAAGGVPAEAALRAAGASPPAYLYRRAAVTERFVELRRAGGAYPLSGVALRANALPPLLAPLRDLGAGAEAVSAAELLLARGTGFPSDRIVLSGVGKTATDLDTALELDIRFVSVESRHELELLNARAARLGRRARAVLRLNPDIATKTHPKVATGGAAAKFGMPEAQLLEAARRAGALAAVEIVGVHAHIGSQIHTLAAFRENAARLRELLGKLRCAGVPASVVDVGGGLGIAQLAGETELPFGDYAEAVLGELSRGGSGIEVVFEPGRCLFGPAGALVVEVLHLKASGGREFVVVDAGMNDFLRPALYDARHRIVPLRRRSGSERRFEIVGGVCETGDVFGSARMPPPEPGDRLAVLDAGAYGYSMSSNYNLRPRPAEVVIEGDGAFLARPAETPAALAARELGTAGAGLTAPPARRR